MKKSLISVAIILSLFLSASLLILARGEVAAAGNQPPTASFTYTPEIPTPSETIFFNASTSRDPDGWIVEYAWDFGDGTTATITNPTITHSYPVDGSYTVQLTVTDNNLATGTTAAVVEVSTVVYFRVTYKGTLIPIQDVEVTAYYKYGSTWLKAPVGPHGFEIKYDRMTQPDLANTNTERYRNPGYTASILRHDASNIGFDLHPSWWTVYFKFQWGPYVSYWPNETTRVYSYKCGVVETHDYAPDHRAYWDPTAGTYVIKVNNIPKDGVSPTECKPIIVGAACPPPPQKYYLTVQTDPTGVTTIPGEGWYYKDANVVLTAPDYVYVSSNTRYKFAYWDIDGNSQGMGVNPVTVVMNANHTATAHYVLQYAVTFSQTGLASDATGTVATVAGTPKTRDELPYVQWVDSGGSVSYAYNSIVSSSTTGKQYRLNSLTGPASPVTVTEPKTVVGNYVAQYLVTFTHSGLDSTATGTVVTVNGNPKNVGQLPYADWFDAGTSITYSYASPVSSTTSGKRFRLDSVTGAASPFTVSAATTVTGNYVTQYAVTFSKTGLDSTATGTVVTVNGNPKTYMDLDFILWVDSGSTVTYAYNDIVLSMVTGKQFKLVNVSGPASPITVTGTVTVTGNYKTQYKIVFDQTGVGSDYTGTVATIDSVNYDANSLPVSFWWDKDSIHSFAYASPLTVNVDKQYLWSSTIGLSTQQSGTLTVTASGSVVGNYVVANRVTFDQIGVGSDYVGTVIVIDGAPYNVGSLPVSFMWSIGSSHSFSWQSPLLVAANTKQYAWTGTTGLSTLQSGTLTVSGYGSVIANYKTQYYLTLATSPSGVASPSGAGWYDAGTYASISTTTLVDIVPGSSRYRFNGWTTVDMVEITDPDASSTMVLMDRAKTVTANYVVQYKITFSQSGVGTDFTGTVVTVDSVGYTGVNLPTSFWWDKDSTHDFAFHSPLVAGVDKEYVWTSTSGLTTLQSGALTITAAGSVTGNYSVQSKYQITFDQTGVEADFDGIIVIIDDVGYRIGDLPVSFWWDAGTSHSFSWQSPLLVATNTKQYAWTSTTGLSTLQNGVITVSTSGSVIGNYKTQYYLTLATNPLGVDSPSGAGWYDAGTYATISTDAFVDITLGCSRYRFNGWTTEDMTEIADPSRSPTTVLMGKAKTVTANYATQYKITFNQTGTSTDFTGDIVTIDSVGYKVGDLPATFWWDAGTSHSFSWQSPLLVAANTKQYAWTGTTGLSTLQSGTITVTNCGNVVGNFKTQYYLHVYSPYDDPTPPSGWFDAGASITESVTSPVGAPGTRYVCTGWTGTGSVPASGTSTSVTFTMNQPSSITWNWKTQYRLVIETYPNGLTPEPTRNPPGEPDESWWYDASTVVTLTAQPITGYTFSHWEVDSISRGVGVNPITITMDGPHSATAYYAIPPPPLSVNINPQTATINMSDSIVFSSGVSGGTEPYTYQWYLNSNPVLGATGSSWTFTPSASGTYYVYVRVTDAHEDVAQSTTAKVTVKSGVVGGYSFTVTGTQLVQSLYMALVTLLSAAFTLIRRKIRKH